MADKPSADIVVSEKPEAKKKVKLYSVALQVRPKDLDKYDDKHGLSARKNLPEAANYYRDENGDLRREDEPRDTFDNSIGVGPDDDMLPKTKPKLYNVSLAVGPEVITKDMLRGEYGQDFKPLTAAERGLSGIPKKYDVSCSCGPQLITPEMLTGDYGQDFSAELEEYMKYTPSEFEMKKRLERKESKRYDAAILSRPAGYRELELSLEQDALSFDIGVQIDEFEVELDLAAERHVALHPRSNTLWPTNEEFTKDKAEKRIEDYISRCWSLDPNWLFHIEFLQMSCSVSKRKYIYEVKFSMPSALNPVPSATASIFFILEVGYYEGQRESVKVHYVVEGTRYQHVPGAIPFQQKWLRGVILEKTKQQRLIDF